MSPDEEIGLLPLPKLLSSESAHFRRAESDSMQFFDPCGDALHPRVMFTNTEDLITIRIGKAALITQVKFPKAILTKSSSFFEKALNSSFREAKTNLVELPEDDPRIFQIWLEWIWRCEVLEWHRNLDSSATGFLLSNFDMALNTSDDIVVQMPVKLNWRSLAELNVLGDKLGDNTFCDAVMDVLLAKEQARQERGQHSMSIMLATWIHKNTTKNAPLREFAIDCCVWRGDKEGNDWFSEFEAANQIEFWEELDRALLKAGGRLSDYVLPNCSYHLHASGKCYTKLFKDVQL